MEFRRKGRTTVRVEYETKLQKDGSVLVIIKLGVNAAVCPQRLAGLAEVHATAN
ncbi:hypothetical protein [Luteolibacter sp. LG18]|uniref:hypothetical protein n=1 Tax=Luteolibacter sp. LG18 TaxID=2819286 RepID=UPI002B2DFCB8|nr:hypothetical protein llg_42710 [Luteolibacter sp. LG18]